MFCELRLFKINPHMSTARLECLYGAEGQFLAAGSRLMDISVDLSSAFAHECPPISYFRLVLREPVWLRRMALALGEECEVDGLIAAFSTTADEAASDAPARPLRVSTAGIIYHSGMWSGQD